MTTLSAEQIEKRRAELLLCADYLPAMTRADINALCDQAKRALPGEGETPRTDALVDRIARSSKEPFSDQFRDVDCRSKLIEHARQLEREARGRDIPQTNPVPSDLPDNLVLADDFGDPETLFNSRSWLQKACEANGAKMIGGGCGG